MSFSLIWESESQTAQAGDDSIENIQAGTDAQVLQMTEDAQPVLDGANEIDKVVQGVGQLGQVKQFVDSQVAQGGMSEQTAQLAQIHVESICNALRYPTKSSPIPASENFGSTGSRLQSTRLASEGIADRAKTMFEAVKKFFKMIVGKAVDIWSGLWNNAMLLEKRLDMMEKKVNDLKGAPGSDQIECKSALKLIGQKAFSVDSIKKSITAVTAAAAVLENGKQEIISATTDLKNMAMKVSDTVKAAGAYNSEALQGRAKKLGAIDFETKDGSSVGKTDVMPGGRIAVFTVTETEGIGSMAVTIERDEMKDFAEKMAPLSKADLQASLKAAREIFTALKKQKETTSSLKSFGASVEKIIGDITGLEKNVKSGLEGDALKEHEKRVAGAVDSIKSMYITVGNYCTKMVTLAPIMSGEIIRGVLDIVGKSASGFKEAQVKS